ncbi:MAG TPA: hypothetical protein VK972_09380 [Wenzhouxiangella sp.]|nr:hypothetical protein [Wenzhouxiangella sp.]
MTWRKDLGLIALFLVGALTGALAIYVAVRDGDLVVESGFPLPDPPYVYQTVDRTWRGWPITDPENFVGAPGRCWIGEDGIAFFDPTGVRVPSEHERQPQRP